MGIFLRGFLTLEKFELGFLTLEKFELGFFNLNFFIWTYLDGKKIQLGFFHLGFFHLGFLDALSSLVSMLAVSDTTILFGQLVSDSYFFRSCDH